MEFSWKIMDNVCNNLDTMFNLGYSINTSKTDEAWKKLIYFMIGYLKFQSDWSNFLISIQLWIVFMTIFELHKIHKMTTRAAFFTEKFKEKCLK